MFGEDIKNLTVEEQKEVLEYLDEYFESVAIGNGDYYIGPNGEIIIE
ncbi:hypothetical protein P8797_07430 [Bacillus subtilis]|nr:hypothetical protein [Bacillus subtilis]MEC0312932.1 hypothetical protein [Bacillus subtilis]MEC0361344.1 hypothetical protein [Bacillus subtilis]